jgi:transposase
MPTAYEIYQTYLKGPAALIRLFEQALGTAAIYGQPPPDLQQRTIEGQAQEIDRLKSQLARLQAEMSELRHHNFRLARRNSELEAIISRDSHNSSRPPSSDKPWAKRTKSLRQQSGQRAGGQHGHTGHTRPLTARPTRVIRHRPTQCRRCHATLDLTASSRYKRRQIIDIIPARLRITEHRAEVVRCKVCGTVMKGEFPKEVCAPVQYGPSVSARALYLHDYQLLPYQRTSEAMGISSAARCQPGRLLPVSRVAPRS